MPATDKSRVAVSINRYSVPSGHNDYERCMSPHPQINAMVAKERNRILELGIDWDAPSGPFSRRRGKPMVVVSQDGDRWLGVEKASEATGVSRENILCSIRFGNAVRRDGRTQPQFVFYGLQDIPPEVAAKMKARLQRERKKSNRTIEDRTTALP